MRGWLTIWKASSGPLPARWMVMLDPLLAFVKWQPSVGMRSASPESTKGAPSLDVLCYLLWIAQAPSERFSAYELPGTRLKPILRTVYCVWCIAQSRAHARLRAYVRCLGLASAVGALV